MNRLTALKIAHNTDFTPQSDFETALADNQINKLFNRVGTPSLEFVLDKERIIDCSGNWIIDEVLLAQSSLLRFEIEADASDLLKILQVYFGVANGDDALVLDLEEYQPPPQTFILGFKNGTKLKLKSMVGDELVITAAKKQRVRVSMAWRGHGNPATANGFVFPNCMTPTPLRLPQGAFTLNGSDRLKDLFQIQFAYRNKLLFQEDAFSNDSVDIDKMERADERECLLDFTLYGDPFGADFAAAKASTHMGWSWRIGPANDGLLITAASGIQRYVGMDFVGEAPRSALKLQNEPKLIAGNTNTPVKASYLS